MCKCYKVRDMYQKGLRAHDIEDVEMVDIDDKVNPWWGLSLMVIKEDQVEELKNGKVIYFTDGEYAHVIALEKVVKGIGHTIETESEVSLCI